MFWELWDKKDPKTWLGYLRGHTRHCFLWASISPSTKWVPHKATCSCSKGFQGPRGSSPVGLGDSPPTEVQDGVGGEHTQDDEGPGHSHRHVIGGIGQEHVRVHRRSKGQEATDA